MVLRLFQPQLGTSSLHPDRSQETLKAAGRVNNSNEIYMHSIARGCVRSKEMHT